MIQIIPGFNPPIRSMMELANTEFLAHEWYAACTQFSTFDDQSSDDDIWYFSIGGPRLLVSIVDKGEDEESVVRFAVLSICWWNTFMPSQHRSQKAFRAEHDEFIRLYREALDATEVVLGSPRLEGRDDGEDRHRWAIWRGTTGLLVLQQSAYDPQFGLDINYWVQPWTGPDPEPTSPFIDWLFRRIERTE